MSTEPLVNEELLEHEEYFAAPGRREELREMFGFERRRLLLGEGAAARLPEECRRLGGGSTMDTAKVGLCVAANGGSTADYFGFDLFERGPRWPLICLPTTAGTGAEASCVSVVVAEGGKQAVYSEHLHPAGAIVDPRLSAGMPPALTAATGLDALGHALECAASKKSGPLGDAVALPGPPGSTWRGRVGRKGRAGPPAGSTMCAAATPPSPP